LNELQAVRRPHANYQWRPSRGWGQLLPPPKFGGKFDTIHLLNDDDDDDEIWEQR